MNQSCKPTIIQTRPLQGCSGQTHFASAKLRWHSLSMHELMCHIQSICLRTAKIATLKQLILIFFHLSSLGHTTVASSSRCPEGCWLNTTSWSFGFSLPLTPERGQSQARPRSSHTLHCGHSTMLIWAYTHPGRAVCAYATGRTCSPLP
jgi:hypothetical protein